VTVVSDSSPLIILAKLDCFELLNRLYPRLYISTEVQKEVVVMGVGLAGASEVENAGWIEVRQVQDRPSLMAAQRKHALGAGEISAILLAKELRATAILLDDYDARKLATAEGLRVSGSVGLLEALYLRGYLRDLRGAFQKLLTLSYIDKRLLNLRLLALGLPQL
jgi:uncharacterized protein